MTHLESTSVVDKRALTDSFSAAAPSYDELAKLQRSVGLELLPSPSDKEKVVLDLGCGTGFFVSHLSRLYKNATITGVDIASGMIDFAKMGNPSSRFICADAHQLPFDDNSVDSIYSNLMFQWSDDLSSAFSESRRVLSANGSLHFSLLTKNTMKELHHSWEKVPADFHLMQFNDSAVVEPLLREASFSEVKTVSRTYEIYYPTVRAFFLAMKQLGSKNHAKNRGRGLLTKGMLDRVEQSYEIFRTSNGMLPVTYEVLFVNAY